MQEDGTYATIERIKINCMQREHGLFQGNPWNPRIGDLVLIYWISEKEAMVLCSIASVDQEPICRSLANQNHQEYVFKLCPWEQPIQCADTKNYVIFPPPKHPDCFKWWPVQADGKTLCLDSIHIFDCLEGHNCANCGADAPCNGLDDHQSSTCFKNFSQFSPTTIDKQRRFKFLHHSKSAWWFDEDGLWRIEGRVAGVLKGFIEHSQNGKIEINSPVEVLIKAPKITLDGDVEITGTNLIDGACTHAACSCDGAGGSGTGTGAEVAVAHGLTDSEGNPCTPSECSAFCTGSGGSCSCWCDDEYIYITCTNGVTYKWKVRQ
jgi:hypothetical protein